MRTRGSGRASTNSEGPGRKSLFDDYAINRALEEIWAYLGTVNKYLADHEPWKMAKEPGQAAAAGPDPPPGRVRRSGA